MDVAAAVVVAVIAVENVVVTFPVSVIAAGTETLVTIGVVKGWVEGWVVT
jgi:hypothetical protein